MPGRLVTHCMASCGTVLPYLAAIGRKLLDDFERVFVGAGLEQHRRAPLVALHEHRIAGQRAGEKTLCRPLYGHHADAVLAAVRQGLRLDLTP